MKKMQVQETGNTSTEESQAVSWASLDKSAFNTKFELSLLLTRIFEAPQDGTERLRRQLPEVYNFLWNLPLSEGNFKDGSFIF